MQPIFSDEALVVLWNNIFTFLFCIFFIIVWLIKKESPFVYVIKIIAFLLLIWGIIMQYNILKVYEHPSDWRYWQTVSEETKKTLVQRKHRLIIVLWTILVLPFVRLLFKNKS